MLVAVLGPQLRLGLGQRGELLAQADDQRRCGDLGNRVQCLSLVDQLADARDPRFRLGALGPRHHQRGVELRQLLGVDRHVRLGFGDERVVDAVPFHRLLRQAHLPRQVAQAFVQPGGDPPGRLETRLQLFDDVQIRNRIGDQRGLPWAPRSEPHGDDLGGPLSGHAEALEKVVDHDPPLFLQALLERRHHIRRLGGQPQHVDHPHRQVTTEPRPRVQTLQQPRLCRPQGGVEFRIGHQVQRGHGALRHQA